MPAPTVQAEGRNGIANSAARAQTIRAAAPAAPARRSASKTGRTMDVAPILNVAAQRAARAMAAPQIPADLEEMFEDAFLYGPRAGHEAGESYTFEERENLLYFFKGMRELVPVLSGYGWQLEGCTLMSAEHCQKLEVFMEEAFDMNDIIPVLERVMITTALYKYTKYLGLPNDRDKQGGIYDTFTLLRDFVQGYTPKSQRVEA